MGHWDVKIRFRYYYYFDFKKNKTVLLLTKRNIGTRLSGRQQCKGIFVVYAEEAFPKKIFITQVIYVWLSKTPSSQVYMEEAFPDGEHFAAL
jgi:hypothetical protein